MQKSHKIYLAMAAFVLIWSAIKPHDYFTWFLEVLPALMAFGLLAYTYNKFRLTELLYALITMHAIILMIGGKYTYAEVPLFNWLRDMGLFDRNNYDKIGHFMQGFVPALVAREILLRTSPLIRGKWLSFISICIVLALSAFYELVEWWVSLASGSAGDSFLGTQGYIWDTQSDMFLALVGACAALLLFRSIHDRALSKLHKP